MFLLKKKTDMPAPGTALPGREEKMPVPERHFVLGRPLTPPFPAGTERAMFGMGCFWGAEKAFWKLPGIETTAVGYAAGMTPNPTYREVCTGATGHAESVELEFDPDRISYDELLDVFWNAHDPTLLNRQGPDVGTQYRSAIFCHTEEQLRAARASKERLEKSGRFKRPIVTEIVPASKFFRAEEYHQQYYERQGLRGCPVR